jgi:hypothetical protein
MYSAIEQKPVTEKLTYQKWLETVARLTPTTTPGKSYTQIRKEGGITLKSAPTIWVRQAEKELGLIRTKELKTHRILWLLDPGMVVP